MHLEKFLYRPTFPPNFVFLALTGAEIAGGGQILPPPPFRARNSQTLSRERVKEDAMRYFQNVSLAERNLVERGREVRGSDFDLFNTEG